MNWLGWTPAVHIYHCMQQACVKWLNYLQRLKYYNFVYVTALLAQNVRICGKLAIEICRRYDLL